MTTMTADGARLARRELLNELRALAEQQTEAQRRLERLAKRLHETGQAPLTESTAVAKAHHVADMQCTSQHVSDAYRYLVYVNKYLSRAVSAVDPGSPASNA